MLCDEGLVYILENHHVKELAAEVESCSRCRDGAFLVGEDGLEIDLVLRCDLWFYVFRDRCFAEAEQCLLEVFVFSVVEESECAASGCGVVNDFRHEAVVSEVEFVSDSDFSCRLDNHIPESLLFIEFPEQEYLNVGTCFLFLSEKSGRENFCVVQNECVALSKIVSDVLENLVLDFTCVFVKHHHAALVSPFCGRFVCNVVFERKLKLEL